MRQSGRTTRIIDFTIQQLFSVGECIVTDHAAFEYPDQMRNAILENIIERVKTRLETQSYGRLTCEGTIERVNKIKVIHFITKPLN
jgi:hypothetical protein